MNAEYQFHEVKDQDLHALKQQTLYHRRKISSYSSLFKRLLDFHLNLEPYACLISAKTEFKSSTTKQTLTEASQPQDFKLEKRDNISLHAHSQTLLLQPQK